MGKIAVLIPCRNEVATIEGVIREFRRHLPEAEIHVFDNDSSDGSARAAAAAGAIVHLVPVRGKGEVVRAMFRDIDADVFLMTDGDLTYPAEKAPELIRPITEGKADMVVATRLQQHDASSFPPLHMFGNRLITRSINALFRSRLSDVLSGYRAFSRRFVKTMPVVSSGFEIETEITLHALEHRSPIAEVPVSYRSRPPGSISKLRTFRDGIRVLATIVRLYKDYRPLQFFGLPGLLLFLVGIAVGLVVVQEFLETGRVAGIARAVFAVFSCLFGLVATATGLILETVNRRTRELYLLIADQIITSGATRDSGAVKRSKRLLSE